MPSELISTRRRGRAGAAGHGGHASAPPPTPWSGARALACSTASLTCAVRLARSSRHSSDPAAPSPADRLPAEVLHSLIKRDNVPVSFSTYVCKNPSPPPE